MPQLAIGLLLQNWVRASGRSLADGVLSVPSVGLPTASLATLLIILPTQTSFNLTWSCRIVVLVVLGY